MLNGTFLVQAIHFFIAYSIVERLLLRPAVREINADQLAQKNLKDAVDGQAHAVNALELAQKTAWQSACSQFAQTQPPLKTVICGVVPQELPVVPLLAQDQKNKIIDECVATLLKKIEHVHEC